VDLRAYRAHPRVAGQYAKGFLNPAATCASAIRHVPKEDLLSDEVTQQKRNLMWAQGAALVLLILAAAAVWQATVAIKQRDRAERTLRQIRANATRRVVALSVHAAGNAALMSIDERNENSTDPEVALKNANELLALSSSFLLKDAPLKAFKAAEGARAILERQADGRQELQWQQALIEALDLYAQAAEKIDKQEQTGRLAIPIFEFGVCSHGYLISPL
jgi:hypothetical protein